MEDECESEQLDVLSFSGEISKHLKFLPNAPEPVFKDFCRLAVDYLVNGSNEKRYNVAAEKLNTSVDNIRNAVFALSYLLINGCKHNLNEKDFNATLSHLNFSDENKGNLTKIFISKKESIRQGMAKFNVNLPMFNNIEWRLECQVSSRYLPDHIIPSVLLDFSLENAESSNLDSQATITHELLKCDMSNLDNLIANFQTALSDTKYHHAKKVKSAIIKE